MTTKKIRIKYFTIALAVLGFFTGNAYSQSVSTNPQNFHIGLGAEVGVPTGQLTGYYNFSVSGTVRLQYDFNAPVSFILTSGFTSFIGNQQVNNSTTAYSVSSYNRYPSYNIVPLKAGVKAYALTNFYFTAEGGAAFETNSGGSTKLVLSPGFGYVSGRSGWDFGLRYDNFSGQRIYSGQFVARAAYDF